MTTYGPCCEKTCFWGFANNKGADHLRSLISTFIIRFLESIICKLATDENSIFQLVSVAEQAGLNLTFFGNPEDRFSREEAHIRLRQPSNPVCMFM